MEKVLNNLNIVLTRARNQALEAINKLNDLGASVISFPTIQISPILGNRDVDDTLRNINNYNTLIFTSENSVRILIKKIDELNIQFDPQSFFVISIGGKTSSTCEELGFRIDFQSKLSTANDLAKELTYIDLVGRKILIPGSNLSNPKQFEILEDSGASVNFLPIYNNNVNKRENLVKELELLNNSEVDLFIFTSPSTFNGYLEIMEIENPEEYFSNKNIAVIGPVTQKALLQKGVHANIIPSKYTMNYLINEITNHFTNVDISK